MMKTFNLTFLANKKKPSKILDFNNNDLYKNILPVIFIIIKLMRKT